MAKDITYKFPKTMGACADHLFKLKEKRLLAAKAVAVIESEEKALKEHIINTLPKSEASGISGKLARVTVVTKEVPQVKDWDAFYKYVAKTKSFDLMQRRLTDTAIKARWEDGKNIPGVEVFKATTISLTKV